MRERERERLSQVESDGEAFRSAGKRNVVYWRHGGMTWRAKLVFPVNDFWRCIQLPAAGPSKRTVMGTLKVQLWHRCHIMFG